MKMHIKVLGSGCKNCLLLAENTSKAVSQMGIDADVEKVNDLETIASYGVLRTPALVIDGRVVSFGRVLSPAEISKLIEKVSG